MIILAMALILFCFSAVLSIGADAGDFAKAKHSHRTHHVVHRG